ncbi:SDR family NAD(P)-dependent oxidoreductase [Arthrobacter sp. GCM10027362]|uniref:SDR family NAD(P)-dependent oxidoreductase n=1 Tax=Arthrobacter sp. GCM10027362 TaxID=3273379 RepID=UPI00363587FE
MSTAFGGRRPGGGRSTRAPGRCLAQHPGVLGIQTDLSDPSAPSTAVEQAAGHFGGIDILVNNAGIALPPMRNPLPETIADRPDINWC